MAAKCIKKLFIISSIWLSIVYSTFHSSIKKMCKEGNCVPYELSLENWKVTLFAEVFWWQYQPFVFALHCYKWWKIGETITSARTRTTSTEVLALCLVEYERCHPLKASGTWNSHHCRHLFGARDFISVFLYVACLLRMCSIQSWISTASFLLLILAILFPLWLFVIVASYSSRFMNR